MPGESANSLLEAMGSNTVAQRIRKKEPSDLPLRPLSGLHDTAPSIHMKTVTKSVRMDTEMANNIESIKTALETTSDSDVIRWCIGVAWSEYGNDIREIVKAKTELYKDKPPALRH